MGVWRMGDLIVGLLAIIVCILSYALGVKDGVDEMLK